ncbi:MAG: trypsin-like peptidase domain-containing protein [Planctomycetaceae bacterium]|jgi:S1-C subfamily serine protease|nr:trypsin-like peptidase domain-containing protein [Planctomycetaceae bacterium]
MNFNFRNFRIVFGKIIEVVFNFASRLMGKLIDKWRNNNIGNGNGISLSRNIIVIICVCVFGLGVMMFLNAQSSVSIPIKPEDNPLYVERLPELVAEERISIQAYEMCNRSVVNIDTQTIRTSFWGEVDEPGAGSGVVLNQDGYIVTNAHVVHQADLIFVTLYNGESFKASVIGEDLVTDIAVIKITAPKNQLFPVRVADSSKLLVGQKIFAIGNPFGLERTLTGGLISSLNRTIQSNHQSRSIKGMIQIDAAINPGNSGGLLLDTQGRMIGINTAIASRSGGSNGVGFAIPSNTVSRIVPQLIKNGEVKRGNIGIDVVRKIDQSKLKGLMLIKIVKGGAAEKAGLRGVSVIVDRYGMFERTRIDDSMADIILSVDGNKVEQVDDFTAVIDEHKPGDSVELEILRKDKRIKVTVKLE